MSRDSDEESLLFGKLLPRSQCIKDRAASRESSVVHLREERGVVAGQDFLIS